MVVLSNGGQRLHLVQKAVRVQHCSLGHSKAGASQLGSQLLQMGFSLGVVGSVYNIRNCALTVLCRKIEKEYFASH